MASTVPNENPCNTADTEDETIARQKKRSRRVSFADREITSVHIFKRDEEYEPSQDSDSQPLSEREKDVLNLFSDLVDDGDANEAEGEDDLGGSSSFLRPVHSPSPGGSSTLCSASIDEENFFGPVSSDFIRPGRLFDSAASDENHDVTMDSTAFSMHFRSLLRSDSGDFKTPTMEENIIRQVNTPRRENLMALTREKHLMSQTPDPLINTSEGKNSEMSLVGENSERYNYEELSPALEALLADSGEDMPAVPVCNSVEPQLLEGREVSVVHSSNIGHKEVKKDDDSKLENLDKQKSSAVEVSVALEPCEPSAETVVNGAIHVNQPLINNDAVNDASAGDQIQCLPKGDLTSPTVLSTGTSMLISEGCTPLDRRPGSHQLYLFEKFKDGIQPPAIEDLEDNSLKERNCNDEACMSPSSGSISSLSIKRQQLLINVPSSSRGTKFATPSSASLASFSGKRVANVSRSMPPILSSGHKLKLFELSPQSPIVDVQTRTLKNVLSNPLTSKALPLSSEMKESSRTLPSRHINMQKMNLEKVLSDADQDGQINGISYLRNGAHMDSNNLIENKEAGCALNDTCRSQSICSGTMTTSSSKTIPSGENEILDRVELVPFASCPESSAIHLEFDSYTRGKGIVSHKSPKSLDVEVLSQSKYQRSPLQSLMQLESYETCLAGEIGEETDLQNVILHECSPYETPTRMISAQSLAAQKSNQNRNKKLQQNVSCENDSRLIPTSSSSSDSQPVASHNLASNVSHNMGYLEEIPTSSYRKRTSDRLSVDHSDHLDETSRIRQSPKVLKVLENHSSMMLQYSDANRKQKEKEKAESGKARMNLTEVLNKLSADTDHMLPASIDRMNIRVIDLLGDILVHKQKVSATKTICSDIHIWASDPSSDFNYKRGADARSFLSKIVFEKSKLQLMCMKRKLLQGRLELLRAKLQQSLLLKANCLAIRSLSGPEEARISRLSLVTSTVNKVATDKVRRMKSEVEDLERKINSLLNSLHVSLKLKGDPNLADTFVLLNNQLKKRTCYRMIHNDIQLWEIEDLLNTNRHQEIVLTYLGFISQRITVTGGMISGSVVSNKLNDVNIMKTFPNMEAFFAFAFVFDSGFVKKPFGPGNTAHETQRTGLLLSNLLDVVEELRLARMEIRNLVQTTFNSPSVGQLVLQLIFRDLISCDKLTVDLDLSCLKWGVYPTDVQPSRLQHSRIRSGKSQVTDEISAAVDDLKVGFWRIIRICRCISRVLESPVN